MAKYKGSWLEFSDLRLRVHDLEQEVERLKSANHYHDAIPKHSEQIALCEGCTAMIFQGDKYHVWEDDVYTCADCGGPESDNPRFYRPLKFWLWELRKLAEQDGGSPEAIKSVLLDILARFPGDNIVKEARTDMAHEVLQKCESNWLAGGGDATVTWLRNIAYRRGA